jgi:hypothetical protein
VGGYVHSVPEYTLKNKNGVPEYTNRKENKKNTAGGN